MTKLETKLVTVTFTARVVVPSNATSDEIKRSAKKQVMSQIDNMKVSNIRVDDENAPSESEKMDWVVDKFNDLLTISNNEIDTFEFCTNDGLELECSTIDKIVSYYPRNEIMVYFNVNTHDCKDIRSFKADDLIQFYNGLVACMGKK